MLARTSALLLVTLAAHLVAATADSPAPRPERTQPEPAVTFPDSPELDRTVNEAVRDVVEQFSASRLQPDELAVTMVDLREPERPVQGAWRGTVPVYPASVVKLFYLVAVHQWLEDGRLQDTPELRRAVRDMIVDSSNEATHYVVDLLTGTTSGPELDEPKLVEWQERRNAVNRYFLARGFTGINVNKKPWHDGPYGRETQAIARFTPKRNMLTTDATARLVTEIATGRAVSPARCAEMRALMARDLAAPVTDPDGEGRFLGPGLPPGCRLWSKAGWTSETRHDAAYVERPDGRRWVVVAFTTGHAQDREILPALARALFARLP